MINVADKLFKAMAQIDGVIQSPSQFSDKPALWVNGKEIAHAHDSTLDIRLTRKNISAKRASLKKDTRVSFRSSSSDWLEFAISSESDIDAAMELLKEAADAHRAKPGSASRPPPVGAELERRRRFH